MAVDEPIGATAVATPAAPMCDKNDLRLSLPSEDFGSFASFSSAVKICLRIGLN
jgi:hypothetical protein